MATATASDKFGLYSECCERFLAPSASPTFSRGERHPTSIRWASSCGSQAVLMCRMTHGCKCRQADNYELQSCALRPQSGPPPPRKKRLSAMRCSTLPGRRLYERLPGRRLKLLATHWPPTPRSRARADTTTVPATATEPEWRSRARGRPRTTSSRCGGRSRRQGLQLAARASHRQARSAEGPKPRHQLLLPGRARSHKSPACKSCGFACERVSACIL